jgi:hypothetical protein
MSLRHHDHLPRRQAVQAVGAGECLKAYKQHHARDAGRHRTVSLAIGATSCREHTTSTIEKRQENIHDRLQLALLARQETKQLVHSSSMSLSNQEGHQAPRARHAGVQLPWPVIGATKPVGLHHHQRHAQCTVSVKRRGTRTPRPLMGHREENCSSAGISGQVP